jgi:hypothetical protein
VIEEIRAEMAATVLEVGVAEGDVVACGDVLALLESMKMEIPVVSEVNGTVTRVAVREHAVVQRDDVIIVVGSARCGLGCRIPLTRVPDPCVRPYRCAPYSENVPWSRTPPRTSRIPAIRPSPERPAKTRWIPQ